ncbi:MAG: molecular chaperone GrpE [Flavobacteriales bacterium]|jgi:molecular chaperone GrpE
MAEETEIKDENINTEETLENDATSEENTPEETAEQITLSAEEELTVQVKEANDKYLRLYSEFDNFRRRTSKEKLELMSNGGSDVLKSILPILDDFERAFLNEGVAEDPEVMEGGFGLIHKKLLNVLEQKGLKAMAVAKGDAFDTDIHESIAQIPAPEESMKGKVIDVIEKGYLINEKILRHAKVVIGN